MIRNMIVHSSQIRTSRINLSLKLPILFYWYLYENDRKKRVEISSSWKYTNESSTVGHQYMKVVKVFGGIFWEAQKWNAIFSEQRNPINWKMSPEPMCADITSKLYVLIRCYGNAYNKTLKSTLAASNPLLGSLYCKRTFRTFYKLCALV